MSMQTSYRCQDPMCGASNLTDRIKFVYFPTPHDTPNNLQGEVKTYCPHHYPHTDAPRHFPIPLTVMIGRNLWLQITNNDANLPEESLIDVEEGLDDPLVKQALNAEIRDTMKNLMGRVNGYRITDVRIAKYIAVLMVKKESKFTDIITHALRYTIEHDTGKMSEPESDDLSNDSAFKKLLRDLSKDRRKKASKPTEAPTVTKLEEPKKPRELKKESDNWEDYFNESNDTNPI